MSMRFRPSVALFLPSLCGGGAERVMVTIANELARRHIDTDLTLAEARGPLLTHVSPQVRVVDLRATRTLTALPRLIRYLRRERPRALLSALEHANLIAIWAAHLSMTRTRVVISIHSTLSLKSSEAQGLKQRMILPLARCSFRRADAVVAVSNGVANDLIGARIVRAENVRVIHNPVVGAELRNGASAPLDEPWFAPGSPPIILGVGRLSREKDFETLIRAFSLLRATRPARLVILGEGEQRPALEQLLQELGLQKEVSLPGFVSNPYSYMSRAAVFVLSSVREGLPTALIEALAVGTPVVSTDCPTGVREILEDGRWGTLVPVRNPQALAGGVAAVLDSPPDAEDLRRRAESFAVEPMIDSYEDLLIGACRRRRHGSYARSTGGA